MAKVIRVQQQSEVSWWVSYREDGRNYDTTMDLTFAEAEASAERRQQISRLEIEVVPLREHQDNLRQLEPELWVMTCNCGGRWSGYRFHVEEQYSEHLPEPVEEVNYFFRGCPHDPTGNMDCLCRDLEDEPEPELTEEESKSLREHNKQMEALAKLLRHLDQVSILVDEEQGLEALPF